jgi:hypothetical protein
MDGSGGGIGGRRSIASASELMKSKEDLTVAVRYLSFVDESGGAVADESSVRQMVDEMSRVWSRCNISFALERYEKIAPSVVGARFNPANYSELNAMRKETQTDSDLLIIGTGKWNRAGDLGNGGSNCFSSFPGDAADGIVCEQKSAKSPVVMAHEAGHWLNLRHVTASRNIMNHLIAKSNTLFSDSQCEKARAAIGDARRNTVM